MPAPARPAPALPAPALPASGLFLLVVAGIFALALAARLHGLAAMPFWLDEVTTVRRVSLPLAAMTRDSLSAHHVPTYFWLLSWLDRGALDEASLRLPSAVFGALTAAILAAIAGRLGGLAAALTAGLLMALAPIAVQYGQEARSYTLVVLLMTLALAGFVELARNPAAAARDAGWRLWPWLLYGLGTAGALLVLSIAAWWIIAANLAVLPIARAAGAARRRFISRWLITQGIILLATLPWFVAIAWATQGALGRGTEWVPPLTLHSFVSTLAVLYGLGVSRLVSFHLFAAAVPGLPLAAGLVLLGLAGRGLRKPGGALGPALLILALAPPLLVLAISFGKSLWMPRYLLWAPVPFFLLVGLGAGQFTRVPARTGAVLIAGLLAAISLAPYYRAETKPRWDLAADMLAERLAPGDLLLVPDRGPVAMMDFFLAREGRTLPPGVWTRDVFAAARHLAAGGRVWTIAGRVGQADPTTRSSFARIASPLGAPRTRAAIGDLITLSLYDRPPGETKIAAAAGSARAGF